MNAPRFRHIVAWLPAPVALLAGAFSMLSQSPKPAPFAADQMDTFLYGAAFYEEYMPEDRLDKDVDLMKQAGINVVRVGESTWSVWEPEDGKFEFAWMDRITTVRLTASGPLASPSDAGSWAGFCLAAI